jgi:uncharacterized protein YcaQ
MNGGHGVLGMKRSLINVTCLAHDQMTAPPVLDNLAARRLFLQRHRLGDAPAGVASGAALAELITDLGFVQVDSVNTLARAHDMILYSRRPTYRPKNLRRLADRDRAVFEHWTHDASVIPTEFYPHWRLKFDRDAARLGQRWKEWRREGFHKKTDDILRHVSDHGPVSSAEVGVGEERGSGGWWDWHPSKTALEYLWRTGALSVTKRVGFRKFYDLTERVIPAAYLEPRPDVAETVEWACKAALDRLGFATSGELAAFWDLITPLEARRWCQDALAQGRIIEVDVEMSGGRGVRCSFAWPDVLQQAACVPGAPARVRLLSPFDPALRDRKRAERLFGFHYRIEIFVPEAQRRYGYYIFPVLEGDRLIGRIDVKCNRPDACLEVAAFWPEIGVPLGKGRVAKIFSELERVGRFTDCPTPRFAPDWQRVSMR